jgi:hypothetical protein
MTVAQCARLEAKTWHTMYYLLEGLTPVGFPLSRYSRRAPTGRSESFAQHSLSHEDERSLSHKDERVSLSHERREEAPDLLAVDA